MPNGHPGLCLAIFLLCAGLASCATPLQPSGDLRLDRQSCDSAYPRKIGSYAGHAKCVNAAIEHDALPNARYPDLVRLQERFRLKYSEQIDSGVLTPSDATRKMADVDDLVAKIEHARASGHAAAADKLLHRAEDLLRK